MHQVRIVRFADIRRPCHDPHIIARFSGNFAKSLAGIHKTVMRDEPLTAAGVAE